MKLADQYSGFARPLPRDESRSVMWLLGAVLALGAAVNLIALLGVGQ